MNILQITGKYLDQPRLVNNFSKAVPALLIGTGTAFAFRQIKKAPKEDRKKELIKNACVLTGAIGSALLTRKFCNKVFLKDGLKKLVQENTKLVDEYLNKNKVSQEVGDLLKKTKTKVLKFSEIKTIFEKLGGHKNGKEFLDKLIPDPENVDSKNIFGEIGRLSLMGLVPVLGGIAGGITGDRLTEKNWQEKVPNKIKEGSYQYLANIFLCNIGAGSALAILEKAKITSKSARAIGMVAGILTVGVIGGSAIANLIGKKFIDPILNKRYGNCKNKNHRNGCRYKGLGKEKKSLYSERKPEALDIGLHTDDIATVAVLSGLKWIEPALPMLYSISGYRAGIGYRNGHKH